MCRCDLLGSDVLTKGEERLMWWLVEWSICFIRLCMVVLVRLRGICLEMFLWVMNIVCGLLI